MEIHEGNTITEFKSTPVNYDSEILGRNSEYHKRNTVRFIKAPENKIVLGVLDTLKFIRIVNTDTGQSFMRKLTDMRVFHMEGVAMGYACWIFSW